MGPQAQPAPMGRSGTYITLDFVYPGELSSVPLHLSLARKGGFGGRRGGRSWNPQAPLALVTAQAGLPKGTGTSIHSKAHGRWGRM